MKRFTIYDLRFTIGEIALVLSLVTCHLSEAQQSTVGSTPSQWRSDIAASNTAPDTVAWASGSLTLGWPTRYHTHSITSNSWIVGYSGGSAGKTLTCFLTVTNATASDFTLSVSNSVTSTDGLRSWTCTNKSSRGFSFKIGVQTNAATQPFY